MAIGIESDYTALSTGGKSARVCSLKEWVKEEGEVRLWGALIVVAGKLRCTHSTSVNSLASGTVICLHKHTQTNSERFQLNLVTPQIPEKAKSMLKRAFMD